MISSNKLYDPLLDLAKVEGGNLRKNDEAMTWIENFSVIPERDMRRKKRNSIMSSKVGTKMTKIAPQLMSKESMTLPFEVYYFNELLLRKKRWKAS